MAVNYELYPCPDALATTKKVKSYYPRVVSTHTAEIEEVAKMISDRSVFKEATVVGAMEVMSNILSELLQKGERVHFPGIGYFSLTASCKKVITQKNARNIRVELKNVVYRPDSKLLSSLGQVEFRCSGRDSHFDIYSPDGWEKLVTKHFVGNRFLTLKDLELESHASRTSCWRHLHQWVEEGRLVNVGTVKRPLYEPFKGYYGK